MDKISKDDYRKNESYECVGALANLQKLDLSGCSDVKDISPLMNLTKLNQLNLTWCDQIENTDILDDHPALGILIKPNGIEVDRKRNIP